MELVRSTGDKYFFLLSWSEPCNHVTGFVLKTECGLWGNKKLFIQFISFHLSLHIKANDLHVHIVLHLSSSLTQHFNAPLCALESIPMPWLCIVAKKIIHTDLSFAQCNKQAHLVHSLFALDRYYIWPYFQVCIPIHQWRCFPEGNMNALWKSMESRRELEQINHVTNLFRVDVVVGGFLIVWANQP